MIRKKSCPKCSISLLHQNQEIVIKQSGNYCLRNTTQIPNNKFIFVNMPEKNWSETKLLMSNFVSSAARRWIVLNIHLLTQSALAKALPTLVVYTHLWYLSIMYILGFTHSFLRKYVGLRCCVLRRKFHH